MTVIGDVYDPNILVRLGHQIPHLNEAFHKVSNNFQDVNTDYEDYFISISVLPAIISGTGVVAILILQLVLIIRCLCCRRPPKRKYDPEYECSQEALFDFLNDSPVESSVALVGGMERCDVQCFVWYFYASRSIYRRYRAFLDCIRPCQCQQPAVQHQPVVSDYFFISFAKNNKYTFWTFIVLLIVAITANFSVFKSYDYFSNSIAQSTDYVGNIVVALDSIKSVGGDLVMTGGNMLDTLNNTDCVLAAGSSYDAMSNTLENLVTYSRDIEDIVGTFPRKIGNSRTEFLDYADRKDVIVGIYFAFIMAVICMLFMSTCCPSKLFLNCGIFWGQLVILTLTVIAGLEMAATILLADFCYNPSDNMLSVYPSGNDYDMISYFLQCNGSNPFNSSLTNITEAIYELNVTIVELKSQTPPECYLNSGVRPFITFACQLFRDE
jgi:hypothetical protein